MLLQIKIKHTYNFFFSKLRYIFFFQLFEWTFLLLLGVRLSLILIINNFDLFDCLVDFCNLLFDLFVFFLECSIVIGYVQWLWVIAFNESSNIAFDLEPSYFVGVINESWGLA